MGSCISRQNQSDQTNTSSEDIQLTVIRQDVTYRPAIDPKALIGHPYTAREDCLVTIPTLKMRPVSVTSIKESLHQPVIEIGKVEDQHLMKLLGICDKELSLSIYLNLVPQTGICLLLKYPFVINRYTRYFSYYSRTQKTFLNGEFKAQTSRCQRQLIFDADATHLVTEINSGIHVIVIVQFSPEYQSQLDHLLDTVKHRLLGNNYQLEGYEEELLTHITKTNVFSNIPHLGKLTRLSDVWRRITEIEFDVSHHRPLGYTLRPIQLFFPSYPIDRGNFYSLREEYIHQLDASLYKLLLARKSLKVSLFCGMQNILLEHLNGEYLEVQHQIMKLDELYRERMNRIRSVLRQIRCGSLRPSMLNEDMSDHLITSLLKMTCEANDRVVVLKAKGQQINRLKGQNIIYYNVKVLVKSNDEDWKTVAEKLLEKMKNVMFFCFDDKLGENYSSENDKLFQQLIDQIGKSSPAECGYADFTFCKCCLPHPMIIGPSRDSKKTFVNVLLLGESGVGKSTFVNALANYLFFDTLEEARAHEPVALMPVSFVTTVGDDFEEKLITFGDEDSNEDYKHPGQSVTQYCRSYVFPIDDQTKMRLIDTPGMGDTRGLDQDDRNMEHILSFVNHLPHLNAVCILLKPNESRLNVVLRSYFTRLVGFLGEHVRDNIVFCFTNTRSTFFAPGNTAPLLKKMLQSHSIKGIPFMKTNTFCFDSESFRYLISRMKGIEFSDDEKEDYERSWLTSRNESNRLREYISNVLKPYPREKWQSIEHAHFQITQLTRPMLETFRNLCRNFILQKQNPTHQSIELFPKGSSECSTICFACPFTTQCISQFLIVNDDLHTFTDNDKCKKCDCSRIDHIDVGYKLEYRNSNQTNEENVTSILEELEEMILKLGCFLGNTAHTSEEDDPIIRMINLIVKQEKEICLSKQGEYLNPQLLQKLEQLTNDYRRRRNDSNRANETIDLEHVYEIIGRIGAIDSIKKQRDVGENRRKKQIQQQEKELTLNIGPKDN